MRNIYYSNYRKRVREVQDSDGTSLARLLHEFATNATKCGALSAATGKVKVVFAEEGDAIVLHGTESGGPLVIPPENGEGFARSHSGLQPARRRDCP